MKFSQIVLTAIIAAAVALGVVYYVPQKTAGTKTAALDSYDRVRESGTLRCGYFIWPPYLQKDIGTGQFSGMMADLMDEIGSKLSLRIEWAEEVGIGDMGVALQSGRIDAMCSIIAVLGTRSREMDFTIPFGYAPIYAVARADNQRVQQLRGLEMLNDTKVKIVAMDGELSQILAQKDFPNAGVLSLQSLASSSELLESVATGKADVGFFDMRTLANYNGSNGNVLKVLDMPPAGIYAAALPVASGAVGLRQMLDAALTELLSADAIDPIFAKYGIQPVEFTRVARPYQQPR